MKKLIKLFGFIALVLVMEIALGGCKSIEHDKADPYTLGNSENTGIVQLRVPRNSIFNITGLNFVKINGVDVEFNKINNDSISKIILPIVLPAGRNEYELLVGINGTTSGSGLDFSFYRNTYEVLGKVQLNIEAGKIYFLDIKVSEVLFWDVWSMVFSENNKQIARFPAEFLRSYRLK